MKKRYVKFMAVCMVLTAAFTVEFLMSGDKIRYKNSGNFSFERNLYTNLDSLSRNGKYTEIKGDGTDITTIMIYMCGSDLETEGKAASADIKEILNAETGNNVNVVIQTGGSIKWHTDGIKADTAQRFDVTDHRLVLIEDLESNDILTADALSEFISFSAENYPADRYDLILWNHGGGAVYGFGVDENNPGSTLTIDEIDKALSDAGVKFDIVGFDACIMANFETALMLSRHADYLIASEEIEPGSGWYYTDFITRISEFPSANSVQIAKNITDDYIFTANLSDPYNYACMSVIDLEELSTKVYPVFRDFFTSLHNTLENGGYDKIAKARAESMEFSFSEYSHIDLMDFAELVNDVHSPALTESISGAVKYNRGTNDGENANGLTLYFPYEHINDSERMPEIYRALNFGEEYPKFISKFLSIMAGGRIAGEIRLPLDAEECSWDDKNEYWKKFGWFDTETAENYNIHNTAADIANGFSVEYKDGRYIIEMSDNFKKAVNHIYTQAYMFDGEKYICLGSDAGIKSDSGGNSVIAPEFYTAMINNTAVPFYKEYEISENFENIKYGYVPAVINETDNVEIMIYLNTGTGEGIILGYRNEFANEPLGKGMKKLKKEDVIEILYECISLDDNMNGSEYNGDRIKGELFAVGEEDIPVSCSSADMSDITIRFIFSDIYNNKFITSV
ncbi:MAG: hypothetical protein J1F64_07455 [Oscillospiraceae bacterium]|nr:hypothetical protein [Oscillospiraceae bacterium]